MGTDRVGEENRSMTVLGITTSFSDATDPPSNRLTPGMCW